MAGNTNFPTALDDDSSLLDVTDGTSTLQAVHHNNLKEAVKAIQRKLGIHLTDTPTTIDFRIGNATAGHRHDGASGQGPAINPTVIPGPSGAVAGALTLYQHLMDSGVHNPTAGVSGTGIASAVAAGIIRVPSVAILRATGIASMISQSEATALIRVPSAAILRATGIASVVSQSEATALIFVPTQVPRYLGQAHLIGSAVVGVNAGIPISIGRTMIIDNIRANLRSGPSGATAAFDVNVGPTSIWQASQGNRPIFAPGATNYGHASPNLGTYPSGAIITLDVDAVGSDSPSQDLSVVFVFRE